MATVSSQTGNAHTIESSEFEPECLDLMKEAADNGTEIVVTENGHTLLTLTVTRPKAQKPKESFFGKDRHLLISYGDIISPIDEDWEAKFNQKWDEKLYNSSISIRDYHDSHR